MLDNSQQLLPGLSILNRSKIDLPFVSQELLEELMQTIQKYGEYELMIEVLKFVLRFQDKGVGDAYLLKIILSQLKKALRRQVLRDIHQKWIDLTPFVKSLHFQDLFAGQILFLINDTLKLIELRIDNKIKKTK